MQKRQPWSIEIGSPTVSERFLKQIDVTKKDAEMTSNLPQELVSSFKIPGIRVRTAFLTQ